MIRVMKSATRVEPLRDQSRPAGAAALLDLPQVRTFVAIADEGSFLAAAKRLSLSQPSVSQHIGKLETYLGVQLFRRNRGECSVTPAGARLLSHARALLAAEERCRTSVGPPSLTITASSNIGVYHLPRVVRLFQQAQGTKDLRVSIGTNAEVYRRVENHEADLGLTEWWDERDGLSAVQWHREPLVVIMAPDHPWAKRKRISVSDLGRTPMIGGESGTGTATILREVFGKGHELKVSMTLGSTEAVKQAVMEGLGISLIMGGAVGSEVAHGRLKALPVSGKQLVKPFYAIFKRGVSDDSLAGCFVSFIRHSRLHLR